MVQVVGQRTRELVVWGSFPNSMSVEASSLVPVFMYMPPVAQQC